MSTWITTASGRAVAAVTLAAGLALATTSCSNPGTDRTAPAAAGSPAGGSAAPSQQPEAPATPLAELIGHHGLVLSITSAQRDPAGYLTVRGQMRNDGSETTAIPAALRGNEREVLRNGSSLAGATLVDYAQGKRYYVLRDTEGRPLTTTGISSLKAKERVTVFMQFPAPPASTTTVGLQLPTFDTANLRIAD